MKVSYQELNSKVSSDLTGISVAQSNKGKVMLVQDSQVQFQLLMVLQLII